MEPSELKIGDQIRIIAIPGEGDVDYYLAADTRWVYKKLIAQKRPVKITEIDEDGTPWYEHRFLKGKYRGWHSLSVAEDDKNWVLVKHRAKS